MPISELFVALGEDQFQQLLRHISMGKLKTFQLYDRMKVRLHLSKLSSESLRKSAPRQWARLQAHEEEFATELAQTILVSHLDMIKAVLDFLGIPHEEGFFSKDLEASEYLPSGWQERVYEKFKDEFPRSVLLFYINHLDYELSKEPQIFTPAAS